MANSGGLQEPTKRFLNYLQKNPGLRNQIRAPINQTIAYAGAVANEPVWQRLLRMQISDPGVNNFNMLPNVLKRITVPPDLYSHIGLITAPTVRTMLDYVNFLTGESGNPDQVPWNPDGFTIWRALSGIFMSNATGRVRLLVADATKSERDRKVFFKTEMFVLLRNPNIEPFSKAAVDQIRTGIKTGRLSGTVELI